MADRAEVQTLLERVEKATGPDRDLDLDLAVALVPDVVCLRHNRYTGDNETFTRWEYTASIDAALALVERVLPGFQEIRLQFSLPLGIYCTATIYKDTLTKEAGETFIAPNKSAPLAILAALLRALIAQADANLPPR